MKKNKDNIEKYQFYIEQANIKFNLEHIPPDNFLGQYVEHYDDITESPNEFLLTAIITAMGALIGSKAFLETGIKKIYPNIWAVILGKTTALRKSTAINLARGLLKNIGWDCFLPQIVHENTLIERLEIEPSGLMIYDEWKELNSKISSRRGQAFKAILTELFDSHEYKKLIKNNSNSGKKYIETKLKNVSLSLIAASTIDWFKFDKSDILSGFLPRFLFCTIGSSDKKPIPFPPQKKQVKLIEKLTQLKEFFVQERPLKIGLSKESAKIYKGWYENNYDRAAQAKNPLMPGFYRRMEQYILKFSLIIHFCGGEFESNNISNSSMKTAINLGKFFLENIRFLIEQKLAPNSETKAINKTIQYLKSHSGNVSRRDLQRNVRAVRKGYILDKVLKKMEMNDLITINEIENGARPGRKVTLKK